MAEQEDKKATPKGSAKKEVSTEQRLLLAFALMGLVLLASNFLYKPPDPRNTVKPVQSATPQQAKPPEPAPTVKPSTPEAPGSAVAAAKSELFTIDTNLY